MSDGVTGFAPDDSTPAKTRAGRAANDWRADGGGTSRTGLLVGTLLALLAVAGAVVGMLFWTGRPDEPRFLAVPVGEYKHPAWPVNPWATPDAARLAACFPGYHDQPAASTNFNYQEQARLRALLGWVAGTGRAPDGGPPDQVAARPLVLHVTALATTRDKTVYLLPGDARPGEPSTWVPVADVLDAFAASPAEKKFLILDLAHPVADPFGGTLRDDAASRLHDLLEARAKAGSLPFPVLTACAPGEASLPADAERGSGFAVYLADGLRGAADGYQDNRTDAKDKDGKVSVRELARFVAARVARWARLAHDRPQTPQLYGTDSGDFFLTFGPLPRPDPPGPPDPYPAWLRTGWQFQNDRQTAGADRARPAAFARLTAGLLRAERGWRKSGDAGRAENEWGRTRTTWDAEAGGSPTGGSPADQLVRATRAVGRFRLAVARTAKPAPPADWAQLVDRYFAARVAPPPGQAVEAQKAREAWRGKVKENPVGAAWLVWDRACATPPGDPKTFAVWQELLADVALPKPYSETLLLRLLAERNFRQQQGLSAYPREAVAALLRAEREVGLTLAQGPAGFGLVRDRLTAADGKRVQGQKFLLTAESLGGVKQARELLTEAADEFAAARQALAARQAAAGKLQATTAALLNTLPAALAWDEPKFDDWLAAAKAAAALADELTPANADPAGLNTAAKAVDQLPNLRAPFAPERVKVLLKESGPRTTPREVRPLRPLVAGPTLPAPARQEVWDTIRAATAKGRDAARDQDDADTLDGAQTAAPARQTATDREADLAVRRARASAALLRLAGYAKAAELTADLNRLAASPADAAVVQSVGDRLRRAWLVELPQQAQSAEAASRWYKAQRVARATAPGLTAYQDRAAAPGAARAASRQAAAEASAYRIWARDQLAGDKPLRERVPDGDMFYPAAAVELGTD
jgi:hypothetical protein